MKDTSSNSSAKKNAGYKAAEYVEDGMVLGLGTGSTTHFFIEKVGMRIKEEGINVMGIPTSFQSLLIAKQWNIPITTLEEHDIDLSVDGADEVDSDFNLIKGGGAAHTKEKIVDYAADKFIVIVDESKVVDELGNFPVPVEVLPDASRMVIKELEDMGASCEIRMAQRISSVRFPSGPMTWAPWSLRLSRWRWSGVMLERSMLVMVVSSFSSGRRRTALFLRWCKALSRDAPRRSGRRSVRRCK